MLSTTERLCHDTIEVPKDKDKFVERHWDVFLCIIGFLYVCPSLLGIRSVYS